MKLVANDRILDCSKIQVMGILNVTPDSFFDGGKYNIVSKAIDHVSKMINNGATIIDIGGESTRPGSKCINEEDELERVYPIVDAVVKRFNIFISVNTSSALVMYESEKMGVHLINDIRSFNSKKAIEFAINSKLGLCLMHMQGQPSTMQDAPYYSNILYEIDDYFKKQINRFELIGVKKNRLVLDPGFGFGKTIRHNYQLLANLQYFHHFKLPILVGVSRKSMINNTVSVKNRLIGSMACAVIAAMQNIHIIRVHDVQETIEALRVVSIMQKSMKQ